MATFRPAPDRPSPDRVRFVLAFAALALTATAPFAPSLTAQCLVEEVRPAFVPADSLYGRSIARDGALLAVGAPGAPGLGAGAGAVYTFESIGASWELASILYPSGVGPGDQAGGSVALSGDTLVIGVRGDDTLATDAGAARVLEWTGSAWVAVATLYDPVGAAFDEFGVAVAFAGDVIAVGSPHDVESGLDKGSVTVFRRIGGVWEHEAKLVAAAGGAGDLLGSALAFDGQTLAAGAPGWNGPGGPDIGAVALFEAVGGNWFETATLVAPGAQPGDLLGASVAVAGDLLLAGAPYDSDAGLEAGAVVPFRRSGSVWTAGSEIHSPLPGPGRAVGAAVDIDGAAGEIIAGEPFATVAGQFAAGRAHRFLDTGVAFTFLDTTEDPAANGTALLGTSVSIAAGEVLAGAYLDGSGGFGSGTVLREIVGGPDCDGSGVPDLCEIAAGTLLDCDQDGIPDSCELAAGTDDDCDGNGTIDSCDIAEGAPDCDGNGVPDSCDLAAGTLPDCDGNGVPDSCDIADGRTPDCDGNGVPDSCDLAAGTLPDCDGNGVPDSCDIAIGSATDCDGNGIPDSCDLASGAAEDCNENGIADSCDVLFGTSPDDDGDGIPDECGPRFIRADANQDGDLDIADAVVILLYVTGSGPTPPCLVAADANGDDDIDIADGVTALSYIVGIGPPPPPPFPECGFERTPTSGISCDERPVCD